MLVTALGLFFRANGIALLRLTMLQRGSTEVPVALKLCRSLVIAFGVHFFNNAIAVYDCA